MAFIALDRKAFHHNLNMLARQLQSREKIALVLKDNAYGHGLKQIASMAHRYGIRRAVVRTTEEAHQIRELFDYILILADLPARPEPFCYTINAMEQIRLFPRGSRVELKVDTGMHRNGIAPHLLHHAFEKIVRNGLQLEGVFTHHRDADALNSSYFWQRKNFEAVRAESQRLTRHYDLAPLRFHGANSAAVFRTRNDHDDMVRVGIAAYGCLKMAPTLYQPDLLPVLSLWGERLSGRRLNRGERVGYGGRFCADAQMQISTYDVGYGDGLLRTASQLYTACDGEQMLGRVSMDNVMFASGRERLPVFRDAGRYAEAAGTIAYEVLVRLSSRLPRRIVD